MHTLSAISHRQLEWNMKLDGIFTVLKVNTPASDWSSLIADGWNQQLGHIMKARAAIAEFRLNEDARKRLASNVTFYQKRMGMNYSDKPRLVSGLITKNQ